MQELTDLQNYINYDIVPVDGVSGMLRRVERRLQERVALGRLLEDLIEDLRAITQNAEIELKEETK